MTGTTDAACADVVHNSHANKNFLFAFTGDPSLVCLRPITAARNVQIDEAQYAALHSQAEHEVRLIGIASNAPVRSQLKGAGTRMDVPASAPRAAEPAIRTQNVGIRELQISRCCRLHRPQLIAARVRLAD